jgi:hypothetical protein
MENEGKGRGKNKAIQGGGLRRKRGGGGAGLRQQTVVL